MSRSTIKILQESRESLFRFNKKPNGKYTVVIPGVKKISGLTESTFTKAYQEAKETYTDDGVYLYCNNRVVGCAEPTAITELLKENRTFTGLKMFDYDLEVYKLIEGTSFHMEEFYAKLVEVCSLKGYPIISREQTMKILEKRNFVCIGDMPSKFQVVLREGEYKIVSEDGEETVTGFSDDDAIKKAKSLMGDKKFGVFTSGDIEIYTKESVESNLDESEETDLDESVELKESGYFFDVEPEALVDDFTFAIWWEDYDAPKTWGELNSYVFDGANLPEIGEDLRELFQVKSLHEKDVEITDPEWEQILDVFYRQGWGIYNSETRSILWAPGTVEDFRKFEDSVETNLDESIADFRKAYAKLRISKMSDLLAKDKDVATATMSDYADGLKRRHGGTLKRDDELGQAANIVLDFFNAHADEEPNEALSESLTEFEGSVELIERELKHLKSCASDITDKMTTKQIDSTIQAYYDEHELGCSFSSFKKDVKSLLKAKKESKSLHEGTTNFWYDNRCVVVSDEDAETGNVPPIEDLPTRYPNTGGNQFYRRLISEDFNYGYAVVITSGYYSGACIDWVVDPETNPYDVDLITYPEDAVNFLADYFEDLYDSYEFQIKNLESEETEQQILKEIFNVAIIDFESEKSRVNTYISNLKDQYGYEEYELIAQASNGEAFYNLIKGHELLKKESVDTDSTNLDESEETEDTNLDESVKDLALDKIGVEIFLEEETSLLGLRKINGGGVLIDPAYDWINESCDLNTLQIRARTSDGTYLDITLPARKK